MLHSLVDAGVLHVGVAGGEGGTGEVGRGSARGGLGVGVSVGGWGAKSPFLRFCLQRVVFSPLAHEIRGLSRVHALLSQGLGHVGEREHQPPVAPARAAARRALAPALPGRCCSRALLLRGGAALARPVVVF